jgi:hypothetical protein
VLQDFDIARRAQLLFWQMGEQYGSLGRLRQVRLLKLGCKEAVKICHESWLNCSAVKALVFALGI